MYKLCIFQVSVALSLSPGAENISFHDRNDKRYDGLERNVDDRVSNLFFTCWWGVVIVEHVISNIYDSLVEQARLLQGIRQDDTTHTTGREAGDKFPIWICEFTIQHGNIVHRHRKDNETVLSRLTKSINVYGQIIHVKLGQPCRICLQRNKMNIWDEICVEIEVQTTVDKSSRGE